MSLTLPDDPHAYRGDSFEQIDAERYIHVHYVRSIRPACQRIAMEFQERYTIGVTFNFGGSSQLLPAIELGGEGDLFLGHAPYADRLEHRGLLDCYEVIGHLRSLIAVEKGNPTIFGAWKI